jgi:hypothetical protein
MKDNFARIRDFLQERLGKDEKRIEMHRGHDLVIRLRGAKADFSLFEMKISFECLDCREKWDQYLYSSKDHVMRTYGSINRFFSKLDKRSKFVNYVKSGVYKIIKSVNEITDEELNVLNNHDSVVYCSKCGKEIAKEKWRYHKEAGGYECSECVNVKKEGFNKRKKKPKIGKLLTKYKEKEAENVEVGIYPQQITKKEIDCEECKNLSPKEFCNIYDCYPFNNKIPVEEYCNEFALDWDKTVKRREVNEKKWDEIYWEGKYEEKFNQWAKESLCPFYLKCKDVDSTHNQIIPIDCRDFYEECEKFSDYHEQEKKLEEWRRKYGKRKL